MLSWSEDVAMDRVMQRAMERVGRGPVKGRFIKGRSFEEDFRLNGKVLGTGCSGAVLAAMDWEATDTPRTVEN